VPEAKAATAHSIESRRHRPSVKPGPIFYLYANGAWYAKGANSPTAVGRPLGSAHEEVEKPRTIYSMKRRVRGMRLGRLRRRLVTIMRATSMKRRSRRAVWLRGPASSALRRFAMRAAWLTYLGSTLRGTRSLNSSIFIPITFRLLSSRGLNDPSRCAPYLLQGGLGCPIGATISTARRRMQAARTAYLRYLTAVLRLAESRLPTPGAADVCAGEKKIAEAPCLPRRISDTSKANNPWLRADFASSARQAWIGMRPFAAGSSVQASFIIGTRARSPGSLRS